ncbi:MAG: hypothetical protein A2534_02845 [Candidatus Magasanikbacteria bacterium RIFOXYD2_FULL_39_9]|uniref:Uncharacterized protein n=1 Tax=Candidatus Magasanikbacteria bacterium RIFOXYD1_FULL_40_23 TaxID=1798705 RepID=A0A1F6P849_9BACT|nr:MAG: hypothetical protein A2563_00820 [Candidatus Magasanikbacteria bacterium RIFOXYD1_FULL_40_23]OGH92189.1 MAG: hypothetical protein A2534_02845 [Candidatus Magasanikbacteria bacterium RIFOXYD2_FULL_39_9]
MVLAVVALLVLQCSEFGQALGLTTLGRGAAPELGIAALDAGAVAVASMRVVAPVLVLADVQPALPELEGFVEAVGCFSVGVVFGHVPEALIVLFGLAALAHVRVRSSEQVLAILRPGFTPVEVGEMRVDLLLDGSAQILLGRLQ